MASKTKHEKGARRDENHPENFLDALTKDEKEALLNKKMEEIRKRNEERQRRYAEIEADRRAAEQMGRAVSLKPPSPEVGGTMSRTKDSDTFPAREQSEDTARMRNERRKSDGRPKANQFDGKPRPASYKAESRKPSENNSTDYGSSPDQNRDGRSKKTDLANRSDANLPSNRKRQNDEQNKQNTMKGVRESHYNRNVGRGKRLTQMSQQKLKAEEYEKSKQEATAEADPKKTPPPDPGYKFLADPRREKALPDSSREELTRRHPRNFGGTNFDNVKKRIKAEKENYGRFRGGPPQTELDITLQMTGRERREYAQWRAERERIDKERLQRQKSAEGMWKREWDVGKKEQSPPTPPISRKMEPGRRPAGRIGSGRFAVGEPDDRPVKGQRDDANTGRGGRTKHNRETAAIWSRGRGADSGYGRGGFRGTRQSHSSTDSVENTDGSIQHEVVKGKQENTERSPKRFRLSSQGSDESNRHVKQHDDKLVIQIDNELASPKSPTTMSKPFADFSSNQGKDFSFQSPASSSGQEKFEGFRGKPTSQGDFHRGGRSGRGRGRGEQHRNADRRGGKSGRPGRGKTVTFQAQPVVHIPELEWDHDPEMKQNGTPPSDWKKDLEEASAKNWNVSEDAAKSWEQEAPVEKAECDGEYMEDQYIIGHEETYPQQKKKRSKPKKRRAKVLAKPKPKELSGFVDENGQPIDDKDGEWLDEEEVVINQVEDEGEVADNELHDSSAESLERFIQEHTLQLNIDATTGDISLENSLPSSQQSVASSQASSEQSPRHRPSTAQKSSTSQSKQPNKQTSADEKPASREKSLSGEVSSKQTVQPPGDSPEIQNEHLDAENNSQLEDSSVHGSAQVENHERNSDESSKQSSETVSDECQNKVVDNRSSNLPKGNCAAEAEGHLEANLNLDVTASQESESAEDQAVSEVVQQKEVSQKTEHKEQRHDETIDKKEKNAETDQKTNETKETSSGINTDEAKESLNSSEGLEKKADDMEKAPVTAEKETLNETNVEQLEESKADVGKDETLNSPEDVDERPADEKHGESADKANSEQEEDNIDRKSVEEAEAAKLAYVESNEKTDCVGDKENALQEESSDREERATEVTKVVSESSAVEKAETTPVGNEKDSSQLSAESPVSPEDTQEASKQTSSSDASEQPIGDAEQPHAQPESASEARVESTSCKESKIHEGEDQPAPEADQQDAMSEQSKGERTDTPPGQTADSSEA